MLSERASSLLGLGTAIGRSSKQCNVIRSYAGVQFEKRVKRNVNKLAAQQGREIIRLVITTAPSARATACCRISSKEIADMARDRLRG